MTDVAKIIKLRGHTKACITRIQTFVSKNQNVVLDCGQYIARKNVLNETYREYLKRFQTVKAKKACLNCLASGHSASSCTFASNCAKCNRRHHTLLHFSNASTHNSNSSRFRTNQDSRSLPTRNTHFQNTRHSQDSQENHNSQNTRQSHNIHDTPNSRTHSNVSRDPNTQSETSSSPAIPRIANQSQSNDVYRASSLSTLSGKKEVLLQTACVTIYDSHNNPVKVRCLTDSASQLSFITEELASRLKCIPYTKSLQISGISEICSTSNTMVDLNIFSNVNPTKHFTLSCAILPTITCKHPQITLDFNALKIPPNIHLADPEFCTPAEVQMLLGADVYFDLLTYGLIKLGPNLPTLTNTHLGYLVGGNVPQSSGSIDSYSILNIQENTQPRNEVSLFVQTQNTDSLVRSFWEIEEISSSTCTSKILTPSEQQAEDIFKSSLKILSSGRFQVDLPFKSPNEYKKLGESFFLAKKRFLNLEQKLIKSDQLYAQYKQFIHEYIALGHCRYVPLSTRNIHSDLKYFISHHCVLKDSVTNKLRVVFDGSMKTTSNLSLNDIMLPGYTVQRELFDILINFRLFKYCIVADLRHMYRQIRVNPEQVFLLNILWRYSPQEDLKCLQLETVTYGLNNSGFLSTRCLKELAQKHSDKFPLASDALLNCCYIDDVLYGCNDFETLFEIHRQLTECLNLACFSLHKWCANSPEFLADSEVVLAWINSHPSRWSTFVANRVTQIQELTSNHTWRHVRSKDNPADILSRGATPLQLLDCDLWFNGPQFLSDPHFDFNLFVYNGSSSINVDELPELKRVTHLIRKPDSQVYDALCKFSCFTRLQRAFAYCIRFIHNVRAKSHRRTGPLTPNELSSSELMVIKLTQSHFFSSEIQFSMDNRLLNDKSIRKLNPFLDSSQMIRVGGRLLFSDVSYDQKFPLLLPSKSHIANLLLTREHRRLLHSGPQNTLSNVRLKFWPLDGLRQIKRIIQNCLTCYRFNAQVASQIMANLPRERVQIARPFINVGVDFGGPFPIKTSKLKRAPLTKAYMAVFVCLATRAVHVELISSLSTEAFLLTLKRFIARRGNPSIIFSDNGTNFLGAKNQLKELYELLLKGDTSESIRSFATSCQIQWKFIRPRSPHHGGIWEAAIKSFKYHLVRIMGNSNFTFEELSTVLSQIEAVLNSRPICALSDDPSDFSFLTPGHFLIGSNLMSYPELDLSDIQENKLSLWNKCTRIQQHMWKVWTRDYLNRLQNRPKWFTPQVGIKPDDLVLLKDENSPPLKWPIARVVETYPGKDNKSYSDRLSDHNDNRSEQPLSYICNDQLPMTSDEVEKAISQLKDGKDPGPDNPYAELIKLFKTDNTQQLTKIFNDIYLNGVVPRS
ncbi:uncharacterized protein [Diabrotica undecimpunctata]|uniref:uncharacterized protein n=1 Tax=Diabrotica undecimpunctata TaxID=50387 RepID=UPI003B63A811